MIIVQEQHRVMTASSFAGDCFANDFPVSGGAAPRISPDCRRSAGQSLNEKGNKSTDTDQHHDRAADACADQKRPGRLAVCFILLGVYDLKDILREEQHEKTDQREKESACQKSPSRAFSPSCFWNCKIKFCNIILQFCRCGG